MSALYKLIHYYLTPEGDKSIPTAVRRFLNKHGNDRITSLQVGRVPLSKSLNDFLNLISLGGLNEGREKQNIKQFYHTFFIINNSIKLEKNQF